MFATMNTMRSNTHAQKFAKNEKKKIKTLIFTDSALATWQLMAQATLVKQNRPEHCSRGHAE